MTPETENPQETKSVCPGKPARHALAEPDQYFTQNPQLLLSGGGSFTFYTIAKVSLSVTHTRTHAHTFTPSPIHTLVL